MGGIAAPAKDSASMNSNETKRGEKRQMNSPVIIASTAICIVELVERNIKEICPNVVVARALDEVDFNNLMDKFERGHVFLESNFCQITTAYLMVKTLSKNPKLRFVIFSFEMLSPQDMGRFCHLGAVGFIDFRSGKERYRHGIAELMRGNEYITAEVEKCLKDFRLGRMEKPAFTIRESQVMRYTARGNSLEEIAELLSMTTRSVQNIKTQVYQKAGIKNNVQILLFSLSRGYVTLDELIGINRNNKQLSKAGT
jgi:two-component system invasion response regulator UvrY